jgi:hypothetical protein
VTGTGGLNNGAGVTGFGNGTAAGVSGTGGSTSGPGVSGTGGGSGPGVIGTGGGTGIGVSGFGNGTGTGVRGIANGMAAGVAGYCGNGEGVYARSGQTDSGSAGTSRNGMHGVTDSTTASGVWGEALSGGIGVTGSTNSATSPGVQGVNNGSGPGVLAQNNAGGTALQVKGLALFSRSGVLSLAGGKASAVKTGIALTSSSLIFATIQGNVAGVYIQGVTLVTGTSGSFTVHLNKATTSALKVAWFVIN